MSDSSHLPPLDSDYPLTADQIAQYRRDGHILLRGVASPAEAAAHEPLLTAAVNRFNTETRPLAERDTYGKAFLQVMNLWDRDAAVRPYVLARRFAKIAADLMGVSGVRIYHDQALYKEPGGGHTPWHQDEYYWPLDTDNTITMWMPLTDVVTEMGTLIFASRSGEQGYLSKIPISDESERYFQQLRRRARLPARCERQHDRRGRVVSQRLGAALCAAQHDERAAQGHDRHLLRRRRARDRAGQSRIASATWRGGCLA